jgi:hypothetical protein
VWTTFVGNDVPAIILFERTYQTPSTSYLLHFPAETFPATFSMLVRHAAQPSLRDSSRQISMVRKLIH